MPSPITGGCLCGRVRYEVRGAASHVSHCHCTMCHRATGSVAGTYFNVAQAELTWSGEPQRYVSSPGVHRGFCGTCGSPLTYENEQRAERVALSIGSLDDPAGQVPSKHIFTDTRMPWLTLDPTLPGWEIPHRMPPQEARADSPSPLTGGCLCGRVRYALHGTVSHAGHCHCTICHHVTGSVASSSFNGARADLTWSEAPKRYESSPGVRRGFCGTCGSPLCYESEHQADRISLTIGSLDDPGRAVPSKHIYTETRMPWLTLDPGLPGWE